MSAVLDRSPAVDPGSIKPHPTKKDDFKAHCGRETSAQKALRAFGRHIDRTFGDLGSFGPEGVSLICGFVYARRCCIEHVPG